MDKINKNHVLLDVLRASILSIVFTIVLTFIVAIIVHYIPMGISMLNALSIATRVLGIVLGLMIGIRGRSKGLFKGLLVGICYILLTFIVFGFVSSDFSITKFKIIDSIFVLIFSEIASIIAVNIKSE